MRRFVLASSVTTALLVGCSALVGLDKDFAEVECLRDTDCPPDAADGATPDSGSDAPPIGDGGLDVKDAPSVDGDAVAPVKVAELALGSNHTCARFTDGKVKCWGWNQFGQLGYGDTTNRGDTPTTLPKALPYVPLGTGRTAKSIAANAAATCAILDDDSVKCWGSNTSGLLGLGDTNNRGDQPNELGDSLSPVPIGGAATIVARGAQYSCAHVGGVGLKCWGENASGQLGLGDTPSRGDDPGEVAALGPIPFGAGRTISMVATGTAYACAVFLPLSDVKCWGNNASGQLGLGDVIARGYIGGQMGDALPVVDLGTGRSVVAIASKGIHACAILDDTTTKCWGDNQNGRLGLGEAPSTKRGDAPGEMGDDLPAVNLGTGRRAIKIVTGIAHTCAILDDETLKCWGANTFGQLGIGETASRGLTPAQMGDALAPIDLGAGRKAKAIYTGNDHNCVVLDNEKIRCWGKNDHGQLGIGDLDDRGDQPGEMGDALPVVDLGL